MTTLSVILPALDEVESAPVVVRRGLETLPGLVEDFELIVVDDGSTDGTAEAVTALVEAHHPRVRLVRHPENLGYGAAIRSGFAHARHELRFFTDADGQFDLADVREFLPLVDGGAETADVAVGYRIDRRDPPGRSLVSAVYNRLVRAAFGVRVRDVNCSFKLFRAEALERLAIESDDFLVDLELLARARAADLRVVERGVEHHPRLAGESTVGPGDVRRTLRAMVRLRRGLGRPEAVAPAAAVVGSEHLPAQRI